MCCLGRTSRSDKLLVNKCYVKVWQLLCIFSEIWVLFIVSCNWEDGVKTGNWGGSRGGRGGKGNISQGWVTSWGSVLQCLCIMHKEQKSRVLFLGLTVSSSESCSSQSKQASALLPLHPPPADFPFKTGLMHSTLCNVIQPQRWISKYADRGIECVSRQENQKNCGLTHTSSPDIVRHFEG